MTKNPRIVIDDTDLAVGAAIIGTICGIVAGLAIARWRRRT